MKQLALQHAGVLGRAVGSPADQALFLYVMQSMDGGESGGIQTLGIRPGIARNKVTCLAPSDYRPIPSP